MKITLINPQTNIWIKSKTAHLGLGYIASALKKDNHFVEIIDLNIQPKQKPKDAEIVGITATTPQIKNAWQIAKEIKEINPKTKIVLGGAHPTALPEESLRHKFIDFVIRQEGEETSRELVKFIRDKGDFSHVEGISYKKDNLIIHNPAREPETNLDKLAFPAWKLFGNLNLYSHPQPLLGGRKPVVNIITSRGCPYNCIFCYKSVFTNNWRARSPENVIKEWTHLVKNFSVKEIAIQDDTFNLDRERVIDICKLIIKENLAIPWSLPNGVRADLIDDEILIWMKRSGCYRIAFGVESGSQEVLDGIGKNLTLDKVKDAFKLAKKLGFETIAFFVMGLPNETEKTLQQTLDFAKELNPHYLQFTLATPYPGTRLYELVKKKVLIDDWNDYTHYTQNIFFEDNGIAKDLVAKMIRKGYRQFYLRPTYLIKQLRNFRLHTNPIDVFSGLRHFLLRRT